MDIGEIRRSIQAIFDIACDNNSVHDFDWLSVEGHARDILAEVDKPRATTNSTATVEEILKFIHDYGVLDAQPKSEFESHLNQICCSLHSQIKNLFLNKEQATTNSTAIDELKRLKILLRRAKNIMEFHAMDCPKDIMNNYSGCNEHFAEYRSVIKAIRERIDCDNNKI